MEEPSILHLMASSCAGDAVPVGAVCIKGAPGDLWRVPAHVLGGAPVQQSVLMARTGRRNPVISCTAKKIEGQRDRGRC